MNEKVSIEPNSTKSSAQPPNQAEQEARRKALFAGLLGVRYPMAQETEQEQAEQEQLAKRGS